MIADRNDEEKGATAVEYGLLVALIAAVIVTIVVILGNKIDTAFSTVSSSLDATDRFLDQPRTGVAQVRRRFRHSRRVDLPWSFVRASRSAHATSMAPRLSSTACSSPFIAAVIISIVAAARRRNSSRLFTDANTWPGADSTTRRP